MKRYFVLNVLWVIIASLTGCSDALSESDVCNQSIFAQYSERCEFEEVEERELENMVVNDFELEESGEINLQLIERYNIDTAGLRRSLGVAADSQIAFFDQGKTQGRFICPLRFEIRVFL